LGFGIGHVPDRTGPGLNFDFAVGLTRSLELGFRTGFRFGNAGQITRADEYGRMFDTETYGVGNDQVANPEARLRWGIIEGSVGELGLEGRAYLPVENGTRFGVMFGMPVALHLGSGARLDSGVFVPVLFYDPTRTVVSIPIRLWFQTTDRLWLGPMSGVRFHSDPGNYTQVLLGFGLGYQFARFADFKTEFLFPYINGDPDTGGGARSFGVAAGIELRIE
jgi:hypothetical protein